MSGTVFAIVLLSVLLVLGNLFQRIRPLLVELGAPLSLLGEFALNVLPVSLIFTVPWAFLSAVLLVFGRLSSDNELTAFRVAGMSLYRLAVPVFAIGLALSAGCLWLNLQVAPKAKKRVESIVTSAIIKDPRTLLNPVADQNRLKDIKVFVERDEGDELVNFHLFKPRAEGESGDVYVHAERVEPIVDEEKQQFRLRLTNATIDATRDDGEPMTLFAGQLEPLVFDYSEDLRKMPKASSMSNAEIARFIASPPEMPPQVLEPILDQVRAVAMRRYASSFACLALAFVAVPLGIKARRRDSASGLILSLAIGASYFVASEFLGDSGLGPNAVWIPNLVCLVLGIILFRRARFR